MAFKTSKTIIAILTFLAGMTSTSSFAYDIEAPNKDGITIYYSWTDIKKNRLAVSNVKYDFALEKLGRVVIPDTVYYQDTKYPVIMIGKSAFYNCSILKSVVIPKTMFSIGARSFSGCSGLTEVVIPNSVKFIGAWAFQYCENLTSVTMSDSVASICERAFADCPKLTGITIPESVTFMGEYPFQNDIGMKSAKINCKEIGKWLPKSIQEVVIGDKVQSIGENAFWHCYGLNDITIPESVTSIGNGAFESCEGLTNVTIPKSVRKIGRQAFSDCTKLKKLVIEGKPTIWEAAFDYPYRHGILDTIVLKSQTPPKMIYNPDYYPYIDYPFTEHTFANAVLIIPEGSYEAYAATNTWSRFSSLHSSSDNVYEVDSENDSINTVSLNNDDELELSDAPNNESDSIHYVIQDDGVYVAAMWEKSHDDNGDGPLTPRDPQSGGQQPRVQTRGNAQGTPTDSLDYSHYHGDIVIPESVSLNDTVYTVIGIYQFAFQGCNELESVTIPQSVKQIGYAGFADCTSLTEITIPAGVELIDQYAFSCCTGLERVIIEGNPVIDETAFTGCSSDLEVIMTLNKNNESMDPGDETFDPDPLSDGAIHYGIDGRRIQADAPGLHIIKRIDGKVVKAVIR